MVFSRSDTARSVDVWGQSVKKPSIQDLTPPSPHDEVHPRRTNHQVDGQERERDKCAEFVELALRQIAARREDDVLAPALRRDHREVAAREKQTERHQW